jgi:hypothetical protein
MNNPPDRPPIAGLLGDPYHNVAAYLGLSKAELIECLCELDSCDGFVVVVGQLSTASSWSPLVAR